MEIIAWIGFSQSLFASLLVGTKREQSVADKILTGWLALLSIEFLTCALDYSLYTVPLLSNSFLLFNPACFLYIKSLTDSKFRMRWIQLIHLLPYVAFELSVYLLREPQMLETYVDKGPNLLFRIIFAAVAMSSWIGYNVASYRLVHKHRKNMRNEFSSIEKDISLGWVYFVVIFYISFCVITLGMGIYSVSAQSVGFLPYFFVYSTLLLLVYILGYYGLMQKDILSRIIQEEPPVRYKKSNLSGDFKKKLQKKIINYFEKEEPYLNPELNMAMLSKQFDVPKYQITEVLNMEIGKNFFQFVNEYRVKAVQKILADKNNPYSIEAIGYECGFNSKSSFFTVFKNLTGKTPYQYRQGLR